MAIPDRTDLHSIVAYLRKTSEKFKWAKISSSLFGVGLVTAAQWIGTDTNNLTIADVLFWVGLALMIFGSAILILFDENAAHLLQDSIDSNKKIDQLKSDLSVYSDTLGWVNAKSELMFLIREANVQIIKDGPGTIEDQAHRFGTILDVLCQFRTSVLLMGEEYWNFSIYLWNEETKKLECAACRRPAREDADAEHRAWTPGEGHVGQAFAIKEELVSADARAADISRVVRATGENHRDYDEDRYRSFASVPIAIDLNEPLGVLVATSNVPGRFMIHEEAPEDRPDTVSPLREMSQLLALLIHMAHISRVEHGGENG